MITILSWWQFKDVLKEIPIKELFSFLGKPQNESPGASFSYIYEAVLADGEFEFPLHFLKSSGSIQGNEICFFASCQTWKAINWSYHSVQLCRGTCLVFRHPTHTSKPCVFVRNVKRRRFNRAISFFHEFRVEKKGRPWKDIFFSVPKIWSFACGEKRADQIFWIEQPHSHYICSISHWRMLPACWFFFTGMNYIYICQWPMEFRILAS